MLPRETLLKGCRQPEAMEQLISLAEQALRTWEPVWSGFVSPELREEAGQRLGSLAELRLDADGGWPQAERCRLLLRRSACSEADDTPPQAALAGLQLSGNFLFDPAEAKDVREALLAAGADPGDLGDIWMRGDRGAQLVLSSEAAPRWQGAELQVRSVPVALETLSLDQLQWPASRAPKQLTSVEASLRLDAVASAGLGLSRNRMAELIKAGAVRVNWTVVTSPSRELACGDRVRLEQRGELEVLEIQPTKRDRWRVRMERR